jgi:hypothetical protein
MTRYFPPKKRFHSLSIRDLLGLRDQIKRAKSTSAQFYVAYELDKMAKKYKEAWQRFWSYNTDQLVIV